MCNCRRECLDCRLPYDCCLCYPMKHCHCSRCCCDQKIPVLDIEADAKLAVKDKEIEGLKSELNKARMAKGVTKVLNIHINSINWPDGYIYKEHTSIIDDHDVVVASKDDFEHFKRLSIDIKDLDEANRKALEAQYEAEHLRIQMVNMHKENERLTNKLSNKTPWQWVISIGVVLGAAITWAFAG